ncbi:hypothetical protein BJV78DRAFT_26692 [Lactifluus subvellereus]|nr:hypothetical protein BJV78DRAFT_26692 [Lactifluus subvellereus]
MRLKSYIPFAFFLLGTLVSAAPVRSSAIPIPIHHCTKHAKCDPQAVERGIALELVSPSLSCQSTQVSQVPSQQSACLVMAVAVPVVLIGSGPWAMRDDPVSEEATLSVRVSGHSHMVSTGVHAAGCICF